MKKILVFLISLFILPVAADESSLQKCALDEPLKINTISVLKEINSGEADIHSQKFQLLNVTEKKKLFNKLNNKSKVWIDKLQYVLNNENLDDNQRKIIIDAIKLVNLPGVYNHTSAAWQEGVVHQKADALHSRIEAYFSGEMAAKIFGTLDISTSSSKTVLQARSETPLQSCTCSLSSDLCYIHKPCITTRPCETSNWGCGVLGIYACLGTCQGIRQE